MKPKVYIITSEYVAHGMTFNRKLRYTTDPEKRDQIYEEELQKMKIDNEDILSDKENYMVQKSNRKGSQIFFCYYKYQPEASNFSVEVTSETLE